MRIIMDNENVTDAEYKKAKKRLATLQGRKDKILQQFTAQEAVIANIVAQQDDIIRNEQRSKSKSKRKK
jgi:ribulose 1,5-bisphosphate carboxylase large subunit-like protein